MVTNEKDVVGDVDVDTSDTAYDSEDESEAESEILRRRQEILRRDGLGSEPVRRSTREIDDEKVEVVKEDDKAQTVKLVDDEKVDVTNKSAELEVAKPDLEDEKGRAEDNTFPSTPVFLKDGGVAVTEEAVEEGVPDVVIR